MVLFSFHSSPRLTLPIDGLSFRWYEDIFDDEQFREAFRRTAFVAVVTADLAAPWASSRRSGWGAPGRGCVASC